MTHNMNTLGPPILRQTYALTLHLHTRVHSFPKQHRFSLGQHLTQQALGLLNDLTEANTLRNAQARFEKLERSLGVVATLRVNLRLCYDLRYFSQRNTRRFRRNSKMLPGSCRAGLLLRAAALAAKLK